MSNELYIEPKQTSDAGKNHAEDQVPTQREVRRHDHHRGLCMKIYPVIISLILLAIGTVGAVVAAPTDSVSSADAIYQVHVTSVTLDPEVFFPYKRERLPYNCQTPVTRPYRSLTRISWTPTSRS